MNATPSMEDAQVRLATQRRRELIVRIFQHCDVWGLHVFKDAAGAFMYKKNRGESLIDIRMHTYKDFTYISAKVQLCQGYVKSSTAVAVAACYRTHQKLAHTCWPEPFIQQVSAAMREGGVRFLGGVFDCPSQQAAALGRSCGAVAPSQFAQIFKETIDGRANYRFSLGFIFVIGDANCRIPRVQEQPEIPPWLHNDSGLWCSSLWRSTRALVDMPRWEQDGDTVNNDLMFLGGVKQKVALTKCWSPGIHQLLLYVGTSRQSQGAKQRMKQNNAARQVKQRWSWGGRSCG
jgi:hypothetical protein